MKTILICLLVQVFFLPLYAAVNPSPIQPKASMVMVQLPGKGRLISLANFSEISARKYERLTGQELSLLQKIGFKIGQRQVKKLINKDGTVDMEKLKKKAGFFGRWKWHWGGFALGFLIILGPLIALFFRDEYKWDRFWTAMNVTSVLILAATIYLYTGLL